MSGLVPQLYFAIIFKDTDAVSFALRLNGSRIAGREMRVMQCLPNPRKSVLEKKKDKISFNLTDNVGQTILKIVIYMINLFVLQLEILLCSYILEGFVFIKGMVYIMHSVLANQT